MNGNNAIDFEHYRKAREKSVTKEVLEIEVESAYKEGRKDGYAKGARKFHKLGIKKGIVIGAMLGILAAGGISMGYDLITTDYSNPSVSYAKVAVHEGTNPTLDHQHYWYDYYTIANGFDPEKMDFDAYVYGVYSSVGWDAQSKLDCTRTCYGYLNDYSEFKTFDEYCISKGFCKEENGKIVIDTESYKEAAKEYLASINEMQEQQENVNRFKGGL